MGYGEKYHVLDGQFKNSCLMCKTTHQKEGKSCLGGFGFDIVMMTFSKDFK